jgi:hypothetical protein
MFDGKGFRALAAIWYRTGLPRLDIDRPTLICIVPLRLCIIEGTL